MEAILIPIFAIVFSLSIPIIAIIVEHLNRRVKMKVIERAIEKDVPLEGLTLGDESKPRVPYRSGMVVLAAGLGIAIFAFCVGQMDEKAFYPLLGISSIPVLIGIALIINDRMNYDRYFNQSIDSPE